MSKTIFYTGPYNEGLRPHPFLRLLSEFYYKKCMCSGCGKKFNAKFSKTTGNK